jgi:hypothetical protein
MVPSRILCVHPGYMYGTVFVFSLLLVHGCGILVHTQVCYIGLLVEITK